MNNPPVMATAITVVLAIGAVIIGSLLFGPPMKYDNALDNCIDTANEIGLIEDEKSDFIKECYLK